MFEQEFFGSADKQAASRKAYSLWQLVKDDKRFESHGRAVGVNCIEGHDIHLHIALTRLQGVAAADNFPAEAAGGYIAALEAEGFKTDRYEVWSGGAGALEKSRAVLQQNHLKDDLEVVVIDPSTPFEKLQAVSELTESCGVMLPMGYFIRGVARPSVALFAQDKNGTPVGFCASVAANHPESRNGQCAFWGMLATSPDRRGERIALQLGAMTMQTMAERNGHTSFMTGIRAGNTPSEKLCSQLGLSLSENCAIIALDPASFSGDRITK